MQGGFHLFTKAIADVKKGGDAFSYRYKNKKERANFKYSQTRATAMPDEREERRKSSRRKTFSISLMCLPVSAAFADHVHIF